MGTGTQDMMDKCLEAGLPEPEFTITDGFKITIRRPVSQNHRDPSQLEDQPQDLVGDQVGTKSGLSRDQVGTKFLFCANASMNAQLLS